MAGLGAIATGQLPSFGTGGTGWALVKADVECSSHDRSFGKVDSAADCANKCLEDQRCRFFIFGTAGAKLGDCYSEDTATAECAEGWEDDTFDFYRVHAPWVGCTEPRSVAYKSTATVDDGSCEEWDTCAETDSKHFDDHAWRTQHCDEWRGWCQSPCEGSDKTVGYRNKHHDTVYAQRVAPGELQVDGDLRDWTVRHDPARCYTDVAFADSAGREASFESSGGGKWFGPTDYSMTWMLAYDDDNFYIGADVTDDVFAVGSYDARLPSTSCYKTGMQLGFEVEGPHRGIDAGMLRAERSADLDVSRFILLNLGLYPGTTSCLSTPNTSAVPDRPDALYTREHTPLQQQGHGHGQGRECCIQYELHNGGGWLRLAKAAILRNENSRHTTYEIAVARTDLIGTSDAFVKRWKEGLRFGFSMVVNDGDDAAEQRGWGGYYPHALVAGWNGGQKEPAKAGVVRFEGRSSRVKAMVPGLSGGTPTFMAGGGVSRVHRVNDSSHPSHGGASSTAAPMGRTPLASADFGGGGYTAPLPVAEPALVASVDDLPMAAVVIAEP